VQNAIGGVRNIIPGKGHISRATASKMASSFEAQFGCTFKTAARYGPTVETGPNESLEI